MGPDSHPLADETEDKPTPSKKSIFESTATVAPFGVISLQTTSHGAYNIFSSVPTTILVVGIITVALSLVVVLVIILAVRIKNKRTVSKKQKRLNGACEKDRSLMKDSLI